MSTVTTNIPLLLLLQLLPLSVALLLFVMRKRIPKLATYAAPIAFLTMGGEALLTIVTYANFDSSTPVLQLAENFDLTHPLDYHAAIDGMSLLFIILTTVLGMLVVLYGWQTLEADEHPRFMAAVLFTIATLISLFTTQNLLWFVLMSAIQLLPIGTLLISWSTSPEKEEAVARFIQFMSIGLLLLTIGTLMLGWNYAELHNGAWSFDINDLINTPVESTLHSILFFLLFYGFAIRIPLFPLHGWLPKIAEHGTVAIAPVFLLGLKTGIYGIIRFVLPILPDAVVQWAPYVVSFALVGIFYAALLAMVQVNLRRLIAFAVVSHTSIVIIGLFSLNSLAFQGTVMLSLNFGLAISGLLLMNGLIYYKTGTLLMSRLSGLFDNLPLIGVAFFISGLSIMGMPGTPGFDAAHLVMEAAMERYGALTTIAASLGNVVAAGFLLWAFQRTFLSNTNSEESTPVARATVRENSIAILIIAAIVLAEIFSESWLTLLDHSFDHLNVLYGGGHD